MPRDRWPTTNEMPSLASLDQANVTNFVLNRILGVSAPFGIPWEAMTSTLARVMDKNIREYEGSRRELDRFVNRKSGRLSSGIRAADHLETCVTGVVRAYRLADALRRGHGGSWIKKNDLPRAQLIRRLDDIRDAAEHIYDRLQRGEIAPGESIHIQMGNQSFELQRAVVTYVELASTIKQLLAITQRLAVPQSPS